MYVYQCKQFLKLLSESTSSSDQFDIQRVFYPGSLLPVHPDAVEDDGETQVEDEVGDTPNQANDG